jgi:LuxR family maltose regulon positive regulatory protein
LKQSPILIRKRINQALELSNDYPLTIVSATMGYGKTTAVREYLKRRKMRQAWVSLQGSGGSELIFWHKLTTAFAGLAPELSMQLAHLGFPFDGLQLVRALDLLRKGAVPELTLVIDDYHLIDGNKHVSDLIELLVQEEIAGLHIVLISRTRPQFNHLNLVAKGLCNYQDTPTLAFDLQEIKDYFELMGVAATPRTIEEIYKCTGGWIAAIYLVMLGLKRKIPVKGISSINQLVEDNLFVSLDNTTRETLLRLAVLECFTLPQAVTVLDDLRAPRIIGGLVEQNAFVEFDRDTGVYRFHHVLLDFLRQKQAISGMDLSPYYLRAGQWYIEHGEIIAAFDYYHRAGKIEELLERLNHPGNVDIAYLGYNLLQEIYWELPPNLCIKYPFPFLHIAGNFIISNEAEMAAEGRAIVYRMRDYFSSDSVSPTVFRNRILGELEILMAFLAINDLHAITKHTRKASELLNGGVSCVIFRYNEFTFGIPQLLYIYYREAGQLKATVTMIKENYPPPVLDSCGAGCEYLAQAEYALETGDSANVEINAEKAIYKAKLKKQMSIILAANFTLMRFSLFQGNVTKATQLLLQTREMLQRQFAEMTPQNNAIYPVTLDLCEGYLYGCLKLPELIPEWLRSGELSAATLMLRGLGFPNIIYKKALLLAEKWVELEVLCESFKDDYAVFQNQLGLLFNSIYDAVAKEHLYGRQAGSAALLPALKAAQQDGVILPFVENADFILPLLDELDGTDGLDSVWLGRLIQACQLYGESLKTAPPETVFLTKREQQVLRLLSEGLTRREMAGRMLLSVASVKKYLESIYRKLDAGNKVIALRNGRKMNLI